MTAVRAVPRKRPTLASLKAEAWAELKHGEDIYEADIRDKAGPVYGLCDGDDTVIVNPAPSIVDSLVHEILHRLHPRMSEKKVTEVATRISRSMTGAEQARWVKQYKAVVRRRRAPIRLDAA
jgi:hypothetical protein